MDFTSVAPSPETEENVDQSPPSEVNTEEHPSSALVCEEDGEVFKDVLQAIAHAEEKRKETFEEIDHQVSVSNDTVEMVVEVNPGNYNPIVEPVTPCSQDNSAPFPLFPLQPLTITETMENEPLYQEEDDGPSLPKGVPQLSEEESEIDDQDMFEEVAPPPNVVMADLDEAALLRTVEEIAARQPPDSSRKGISLKKTSSRKRKSSDKLVDLTFEGKKYRVTAAEKERVHRHQESLDITDTQISKGLVERMLRVAVKNINSQFRCSEKIIDSLRHVLEAYLQHIVLGSVAVSQVTGFRTLFARNVMNFKKIGKIAFMTTRVSPSIFMDTFEDIQTSSEHNKKNVLGYNAFKRDETIRLQNTPAYKEMPVRMRQMWVQTRLRVLTRSRAVKNLLLPFKLLQRLYRRAACFRVERKVRELLSEIAYIYVYNITYYSIIFAECSKRKTLLFEDFEQACSHLYISRMYETGEYDKKKREEEREKNKRKL